MVTPPLLAHLDGERGHALEDHLVAVAALAFRNAAWMPGAVWASNAGRVHDVAKAPEEWQAYLNGQGPMVPHAHLGAVHAVFAAGRNGLPGRVGIPISYAIAGHHAGLPDWTAPDGGGRTGLDEILPPFATVTAEQGRALETARLAVGRCLGRGLPPDLLEIHTDGGSLPNDPRFSVAFWIRMIFSALVDADFLDTEAFYKPGLAVERERGKPSLLVLKQRLDGYLQDKAAATGGNADLHAMRQDVLEACRLSGRASATGLKRLNVPTGFGKTLSGFAFALEHALARGLDRVIYVAPYLSIIDQTATELRRVFGDAAVVEHHSGTDPENESWRRRLSAENWDAPIVVTTAVQFLESLHANRPSRCRKLHSITGSVVILDEAQVLPPGCIAPAAHAIEQLVRFYGSTVVLMTATQPGLEATFSGMPEAEDIVSRSDVLHQAGRRVRVERPSSWRERVSIETVAGWMRSAGSALTILDSRADARRLFSVLGLRRADGAYHMSTYQCPAHRKVLLKEIRERLAAGLPTLVVSTRLIEAGVDVDFPVVFRAVAGLDSMIQAAGRANREGRLKELGLLRVFVLEGWKPRGHLRLAAEAAMSAMDEFADDPLAPKAVAAYFRKLHWQLGSKGLDENDVLACLDVDAETLARPGRAPTLRYQFEQASERFKMIDGGEASVVVKYGEGTGIIQALLAGDVERSTLRKAAQHAASIPAGMIPGLEASGSIRETESGLWVQMDPDAYDDEIGWIGRGNART